MPVTAAATRPCAFHCLCIGLRGLRPSMTPRSPGAVQTPGAESVSCVGALLVSLAVLTCEEWRPGHIWMRLGPGCRSQQVRLHFLYPASNCRPGSVTVLAQFYLASVSERQFFFWGGGVQSTLETLKGFLQSFNDRSETGREEWRPGHITFDG